ncbi:MAG: hypothetical protein GXW85_05695 [Clostridia bacterium]|nr:hypothetical protein [Clostridia bacterium]
MLELPLMGLIFQGIPEQIGVVMVAFAIANLPFNIKKIFFSGSILAICAYFIRMLPITFGVHTVVLVGLLIFILYRFGNVNINASIFSVLISFLLLIIYEMLSFSVIVNRTGLSYEEILMNQNYRFLIALPHILLLYLTAFLIKKYRNRPLKQGGFYG